MGLLPGLKISFEKPDLEVHEDVKQMMKKPPKPKKEAPPLFWDTKQRIIVGIILAVTLLGSLFFYYKGSGALPQINIQMPSFSLGGFGINETIIIEK